VKIACIALSAAALALAVPATAHADNDRVKFSSPSGNIRCVIDAQESPAAVMCQLAEITYTVRDGDAHDANGAPCPKYSAPGRDVRMVAGQPSYVSCSYAALDGGVGPWPTLAYGQSIAAGPITCDSSAAAVRCIDSGSGYFLRISRDAYFVG
jgi:hypothetical protein